MRQAKTPKHMNCMKKILFILCVISIHSCSSKPHVVIYIGENEISANHKISITNHGLHTGIVLSSQDANEFMPFLLDRFGEVPFYEFGWGDKMFYQAKEVTVGLAIQAVFWPTDSVVRVVAVYSEPSNYFPEAEVIELILKESQMKSLNQFISTSFFRNSKGEVTTTSDGYYKNSQFYQGEGDYYLFNTCNKWTAKALRSAGLDISTSLKLSSGSIFSYLKQYCASQTNACSGPM